MDNTDKTNNAQEGYPPYLFNEKKYNKFLEKADIYNKLKEIRDKYDDKISKPDSEQHFWETTENVIIQIQSETLDYGKQLGREEVIKEIDQWSKRRFENYLTDKNRKAEHLNLWDKLNQLKEQK